MVSQINNQRNSNFHLIIESRLTEIKSKIQNLQNRLGLQNSVKLTIGQFAESPCAQLLKNTVQLPSWFLFKYEDIPQRFRISNENDPRLTDDVFLNDLAFWMNEKLQEAGISSVVRPADYGVLQKVVRLLSNRDLYEKSKEFIIAHELAHFSHEQVHENNFYLHRIQESISVGGVIVGILLLVLAVSILPHVSLGVVLVTGGIGIAVLTSALIGRLNRSLPAACASRIEEEKLADVDAVKALQDAQGGVYYFDSMRLHHLAVRATNPPARNHIDAQGNNLKDRDHPPITDRIAYLRQWQASQQRA